MNSYNTIILEQRGKVAWIYLNRPGALNAVSIQLITELGQALQSVRDEDSARVVVLSGKGRAFCAGADLKTTGGPEPAADASDEFLNATETTDLVLRTMPKPVIAALNGLTVAGGLEMAMMCDLVFAVESAKIGDGHSNFGVIPGGGSTYRLPRIIGLMRARYLMYSGELFTARQMEAMGLVSRVVQDGALEQEVQSFAEKLAAKSPLGLRRMKELINSSYDLPSAEAFAAEKRECREHMHSYDAVEGAAAFAARRKPQFIGR
jgi:enoyl-CoA hydratase/carnithine racemase